MARYVKGDIVVVNFPFSSQEGYKQRPVLIIASWPFRGRFDYLVALISTQFISDDPYLIDLETTDFNEGVLPRKSFIRPSYLWSVGQLPIQREVCSLKTDKMQIVSQTLQKLVA